jgi:hypothetical protein
MTNDTATTTKAPVSPPLNWDIATYAEWFLGHAHDWYFQAHSKLEECEWELKRIEPIAVAQTVPAPAGGFKYAFALTAAHIEAPAVCRFLELQLMAAHHRATMQRFAPFYFYTLGVSGLSDEECSAFVSEFFIFLGTDPERRSRYEAQWTRADMLAHINDE